MSRLKRDDEQEVVRRAAWLTRILDESGMPVEYGEPLIIIE